jgi:triphosphoribosyl-dephospho-CoA synthase
MTIPAGAPRRSTEDDRQPVPGGPPRSAAELPATVTTILESLPAGCPPGGRGWCAAAAGILEASAAKPGNVHPGAAFADLSHADLVAAAVASAPAIEQAPQAPLGRTIRAAVAASREVTPSNANLGIMLLVAPLAAADDGGPLDPAAVARVLAGLMPADAADVWEAIGLAAAGGLGAAVKFDVRGPPPVDLLAAMREARDRDQIARLWAGGYEPLFAGPVADLRAELAETTPAAGRVVARAPGPDFDSAIVRTFLLQLARAPDSLIARRHGAATAADVSRRAAEVLAAGAGWRAGAAELDRFLRSPRRLNPGTTADLVAAALYVVLRSQA